MSFSDHPGRGEQPRGRSRMFRMGLVLIGLLAIAGALLFTEHRAHVRALIYLPLLCPLMHLFMHGGHGGHHGHGRHRDENNQAGRSER